MRVKGRFYVVLTLLLLILVGIGAVTLPFFQVRYVEVRGTQRLSEQGVDNLGQMVKGSNLFLVDRKKMKEAVETDPYLQLEKVRYALPNKLILHVKERKAEFYLTHLDNDVIISSEGIVLSAQSAASVTDIPKVEGIPMDAYTVGEAMHTGDQDKLDILTEILAKFEESGMLSSLASVDMSDVMHIKMTSAKGYTIAFGSRENIERKIEWLYTILKQVEEQQAQSCSIDVSTAESPTYKIEN